MAGKVLTIPGPAVTLTHAKLALSEKVPLEVVFVRMEADEMGREVQHGM